MSLLKSFRARLRGIDWTLVGIVVLLNVIGLITLYGVTIGSPNWMRGLVWRQLVWSGAGIALLFLVIYTGYEQIFRFAVILYVVGVGLVILPILLGIQRKGAYSWLVFGGLSVQPTEFAKISLIIMLAWYLDRSSRQKYLRFFDLIIVGILAFIPTLIVAIQPDFGSAVIFIFITFGILFLGGLKRTVIMLLILGLVVGGVMIYPHLKPYQKARLKVFLNPWEDSLGKGYNIVQSEIAVGSGGLWGKGFGKGSQTRYRFLPQHYTDFIFAGFIEQFGLLGGVLLILLYAGVLYRLRKIAIRCKEASAFFLVGGVMALISAHVVLNIGITLGLFPVTGLPLPWLSYGGSSLVSSYVAVGLALTTNQQRRIFSI